MRFSRKIKLKEHELRANHGGFEENSQNQLKMKEELNLPECRVVMSKMSSKNNEKISKIQKIHQNQEKTSKKSSSYKTLKRQFIPNKLKMDFTPADEILECPHCDFTFSCYRSYKDHIKRHPSFKHKCIPSCGMTFLAKISLKRHEMSTGHKQPNDDADFDCTKCDMKFSSHHHLTRHLKSHKNFRLSCIDACGMKFSKRVTLMAHAKRSGHNPVIELVKNDGNVSSSSKVTRKFDNSDDDRMTEEESAACKKASRYGCVDCDLEFADNLLLWDHLNEMRKLGKLSFYVVVMMVKVLFFYVHRF
jgi:hypothetical protein